MWNLSGDDIQRAKEELKGRRAAIKAHYDKEMKQLEADIAAIESFERAAVDFVSNFKGEQEPSAAAAAPPPAVEPEPMAEPATTDSVSERNDPGGDSALKELVAADAASEPVPSAEPAAGGKGSSRWRMRLGNQ
jgi:hypothetical protein